ncbi:unnamed protein product, partial [Effrenium voratum]
RRRLGDSVQGPPVTDLPKNLQKAKEFFTKPALSYGEFKQQCVSLRPFAFAAICSGCVLSLVICPLKSSYWATWGPLSWLSYVKESVAGTSPPLFLKEKRCANATQALRPEPAAAAASLAATAKESPKEEKTQAPKPRVLFVLGGPGAGKGTQCGHICGAYPAWGHISAGDCLRAERQDPDSKDGELINSYIKEGKIVPVEITVRLLQKAMVAGQAEGKTSFLIDGFPRNLDNVTGWESVIGDSAEVLGVLFYEASELEMEKRLLGRSETSGRVDDNIESIRKRFQTYQKETMPIVEKYKAKNMVFTVDGMQTVDDVWTHTNTKLREIETTAKYGR